MSEIIEKREKLPIIHFIVVFLFMFGFRYLPPIGEITPYGMQVIGIFIAVLYGWTTSGNIWPSLLGICALGYLDGNDVFGTLGISFSDNLVLTTLFFFCFSAILEEVGLTKYIANWCISRKFANGRPYMMVTMFCFAALLLSTFVNLFASLILLTTVFGAFCQQAGFKCGDRYPAYGSFLVILACTVGGGIFPFMGQSYVINTVMEKMTGMVMNYVLFTVVQIVFAIVTLAIAILVVKFIVKPDVSLLYGGDDRFACYRNDKMDSRQKQALVLIVLLMVLLFMPGILPAEWAVTAWLKNLSVPGAAAFIVGFYYIINLGRTDVISFKKVASGINWDLILMFATIAPLVVAVNAKESNIMPSVVSALSGILGGLGPIAFIIVFFFLAMCVSQFINNIAVVLAFLPVMFSFSTNLNINPLVIGILASYILNISLCTPTASGGSAYMFSFKWIPGKLAVKCGIATQILVIVLTAIATPIVIALVG